MVYWFSRGQTRQLYRTSRRRMRALTQRDSQACGARERKKGLEAVAWMVVAAVAAVLAASAPAALAGEPGTLVVTGQAEVKAEPDMAVVRVGADTRGGALEEARAANGRGVQQGEEAAPA